VDSSPFDADHVLAVRRIVKALAGDADATGVQLRMAVRIIANQYDAAEDEALRQAGLSGPRWALLLRVMGEEVLHGRTDISPTYLSRCLQVSKNTVSALLNGLDEQGLLERVLDPDDRRAIHIHLTPTGREVVMATAPEHVAFLNRVSSRLAPEERAQMINLLVKLYSGLSSDPDPIAATAETLQRTPNP